MGGQPVTPPGTRLYAIGDIHGCLDQLKDILNKIEKDSVSSSGSVQTIFLGDYVDRGLYSRQTIDFLLDWETRAATRPVFLLGNHEQVMRSLLRKPDRQLLEDWFCFGGRETLMSYGINPSNPKENSGNIFAAMAKNIPQSHVDFLDRLQLSATFGDYFFCHAGVRPGVNLAEQTEQDLTWIRYEFLHHTKPFGKIVVHGHTISHDVQFMPNRIGVDTGAFATGCLTALVLEDTKQWVLQTGTPHAQG